MPGMLVPNVVERSNRGERAWDLFSRLLAERIVFLGTPIDDDVANVIVGQLLHLEGEAPDRDIQIYINSPGGDMTALFAIYDTMQYVRCDVSTLCVGQACSAASVLLAAGTAGKRFALPNARVLIHQPHGGMQGQAADLELAVAEVLEMRRRMVSILSHHTGQDPERILTDIDRDRILRGPDAVDYGLIDAVITSREPLVGAGFRARS